MHNTIAVGIIGVGRSGWELHAQTLREMADYRVAAICDASAPRLARAAEECGALPHAEPQALIGDPDLDLVVVAVPGSLHASLAIAALEAGKHVVVEKPMASTAAEADEMLAAARTSGRLLSVFHNRRWDPDYRMLRLLVERGEFGELLTVDSRIISFGPEWPSYGVPEFNPRWRTQAAYGGGFLADWGPHLVDQVLDLVDEWPTRVSAELRSHLWCTEVDDSFHIRLSFASGLLVTVEGSNNARIPLPRWFVVGADATLISGSGFGHWTEMSLCRGMGEAVVDLAPEVLPPVSAPGEVKDSNNPTWLFYEDLAAALREGRGPAISAEHSRDVVAILDAARRSSETGQTVTPDSPLASYGACKAGERQAIARDGKE
jgi:scyllo-inositol 2-dehydrogenase (NADP+)